MQLLDYLIPYLVIIISVILHEIAHGYVAYKCGDMTAKLDGRLTLNPIPHIDPLGTIILPLFFRLIGSPVAFGWAKPVPVNYHNLKGGEKDFFWVSFAGIAVNLSLALIAAAIYRLTAYALFSGADWISYIASTFVFYNILLALFNLAPIPPLDGSRLIRTILPAQYQGILDQIEPYGFFLVFTFLYVAGDRLSQTVITFSKLLLGA